MSRRLIISLTIGIALLVTIGPSPVKAEGSTYHMASVTVGFSYVSTYKNRLLNAQAAVTQMQRFFDTVSWDHKQHYSFLRDVLHNDLNPADGYVDTPLGYGFGSCGASSLLNELVQTASFRDSKGQDHHVFQTILVWTWRGDKSYGKYGATIFLSQDSHRRDYIWQLNPAYQGPAPKITTDFDMNAEKVAITMQYADQMGQ